MLLNRTVSTLKKRSPIALRESYTFIIEKKFEICHALIFMMI